MSEAPFDLVIYHAHCWDGFTAAWVARMHSPAAEFVAASYGEEPPDVTGKRVLIADFSYSRTTLTEMQKKASSLLVLDHHKSAKLELEGLAFCVFDMKRSGAGLTWDHLFPGMGRPELVDYVEDRDLWKFELPHSKAVNAYLQTKPKEFHWLDSLNVEIRDRFASVMARGNTALAVVDNYVASQVRKATSRVWIAGHIVPIVNTTFAISEVVGELAEGYPFAVGWFFNDETQLFQYSLRSRQGGVDVSEVAKQFGGGGHPGAAGFALGHKLEYYKGEIAQA